MHCIQSSALVEEYWQRRGREDSTKRLGTSKYIIQQSPLSIRNIFQDPHGKPETVDIEHCMLSFLRHSQHTLIIISLGNKKERRPCY